ncbi:MAG: hypothetical protein M1546_08380 [Chloroflexi bacterium]|nr:hypothetical protein [Chloroflexota bacterium]
MSAPLTAFSPAQLRAQDWAALNDLFRATPPPSQPLDGFYAGQFVGLRLAPGVTQLAEWVAARWMPWLGKRFSAGQGSGDNTLRRDSYWIARAVWPLYRGYHDVEPRVYRAFTFRTSYGERAGEPGSRVFRLDYDVPGNPRLTVRRIVDELVQLEAGFYLGRMVVHWWWGQHGVTAYFTLKAVAQHGDLARR